MINEMLLKSLLQELICDYSRESKGLAKIYLERLDKVFKKGEEDEWTTSSNSFRSYCINTFVCSMENDEMKSLKCKYPGCDKVIEGFNKNHAKFLMSQHQLKHKNDEKREKEREEKLKDE